MIWRRISSSGLSSSWACVRQAGTLYLACARQDVRLRQCSRLLPFRSPGRPAATGHNLPFRRQPPRPRAYVHGELSRALVSHRIFASDADAHAGTSSTPPRPALAADTERHPPATACGQGRQRRPQAAAQGNWGRDVSVGVGAPNVISEIAWRGAVLVRLLWPVAAATREDIAMMTHEPVRMCSAVPCGCGLLPAPLCMGRARHLPPSIRCSSRRAAAHDT